METSGLCFLCLAVTVHIGGRRLNKSSNPFLMDSFNTKNCFTCNRVRAALFPQRSEPGRSVWVELRRLVSLDCLLPAVTAPMYLWNPSQETWTFLKHHCQKGSRVSSYSLLPIVPARNILRCLGKNIPALEYEGFPPSFSEIQNTC